MKQVLLLIFVLITANSFCQIRQVSGKITDSKDGLPIVGATIRAKNGKTVTISQSDGSFAISVADNVKQLEISYVGYTPKTVDITGTSLQIAIVQNAASLNEVIVVGYGTASKRNITGSISSLSGAEVANTPTPSFEQAMQGKSPGVVVQSGSGKLGNAIEIQIRGISSVSAGSQPLYVIDGLPVISSSTTDPINGTSISDEYNDAVTPLADLNPNDIESIQVLKDASASAIYGARAANGVVLITTKKGKAGEKTQLQLDINHGWSNPERTRQFCDAKQYVDLINIAAKDDAWYDSSSFSSLAAAQAYYLKYYTKNVLKLYSLGTDYTDAAVNTDWSELFYIHDAPNTQINLSASGGNAKTKYYVSGFYDTQDAIVIGNKFSRYGARLNLEQNATDKLSFGINVSVDRSELDRIDNDDAFSSPGQIVAQLPISPLYDPQTGILNDNTLYPDGLYDALYNSNNQVTYRTLGDVYANYDIIPSLSFRSEFGADILTLNEDEFQAPQTDAGSGGHGSASTLQTQTTSFNTNNYFTYTPKIGEKNKLSAVLGESYEQNNLKQSNAYGEQFPSDAIKNLSGATSITSAVSRNTSYAFLSYFLRANYSFKEKYLLSASIRTDGSSRFGPDDRYGWFPSASAGWVLTEENFLKTSKAISFLKIRGSWGQTGNAEIGENQFYSLYTVTNYPSFPGFAPLQLGNPDLHWEKNTQTDVGVDYGFLNNRITGTIDAYYKHSTDLLLNVNIPATTGYTNILENLGALENKGLEFSIETKNFDNKNFKWTTSFNIAFNKNKILNLDGQTIIAGFEIDQIAQAGQPIGAFYGPKFLGVDPANGDALYLGADGKPTNDYSAAPFQVLGKPNPDFTGGFTNTFSYKGFDLSVFFNFVSGNQIYNGGGLYMSDGFYNGFDNQTTNMLNAWQKPGDITNVPRIGYWYGSGNENSSEWLYDGSYIRLKNATLGYTIPKSVMNKMHLTSAKIYVSGTNLWIKTKYPGDPEVNTETISTVGGGQDFYTIPQPRTITVGLSVTF